MPCLFLGLFYIINQNHRCTTPTSIFLQRMRLNIVKHSKYFSILSINLSWFHPLSYVETNSFLFENFINLLMCFENSTNRNYIWGIKISIQFLFPFFLPTKGNLGNAKTFFGLWKAIWCMTSTHWCSFDFIETICAAVEFHCHCFNSVELYPTF